MFDVHPFSKSIYLLFLSLGVIRSESDALHFLVSHDEISRQIVICNDDYKFVAYPYSILHEFAVDNEVTIHLGRFFFRNCEQVACLMYLFL